MIDFGKIVYMDVQKTGSSYITKFLRDNLLLREKTYRQHSSVRYLRRKAFYFSSVRDPLRQYISLYQFGLAGRGSFAHHLAKAGKQDLYQAGSTGAFEKWLEYVLMPESAPLFGSGYQDYHPALLGFQTFRYISLCFTRSARKIRGITDKPSLRALYARHNINQAVIKTESLTADLENLVNSELGTFFKPPEQVLSYLQNDSRVNKSKLDPAFQPDKLSPDLVGHLKEREWFIYETFYPQQAL